jgi:hypothetical protein
VYRDDFSALQAAMLGSLGAVLLCGVVFAFNAVLYFLLGPSSPAPMLGLTVLAVALFAVAFLMK